VTLLPFAEVNEFLELEDDGFNSSSKLIRCLRLQRDDLRETFPKGALNTELKALEFRFGIDSEFESN